MKLCDRCLVSGCCLNYLGDACKRARKRECPDIVYTVADSIRDMKDEELSQLLCVTRWKVGEESECLEWLKSQSSEN